MELELNEAQVELRDGLRTLLQGACDIRHVRDVAYQGEGVDPPLWAELARAGWTGVTVPEAEGGADLGFEELMIVAMEAGRAVLHLPLVTSLLAARTIARVAVEEAQAALLATIARGDASVTLALRGSPADRNGEPGRCLAVRAEAGWRISGEHLMVPYGPQATLVMVEAEFESGGRGLFLVPTGAPGVQWTALQAMDRSVRMYNARLDDCVVGTEASIAGSNDAAEQIDSLLDEWRVLLSAESLGACEPMLERSVEYAKERVAFGRPIGSNQAVKVRIAEMATQVERMRAAVYYAAMSVNAGDTGRHVAVAMAKAATSAPATFVGTQAIHVHGGIGYTWEHDLHLYFKRLKSNELLLGDTPTSLRRVADAVI